jgi:hypothetical protein
MISSAKRRPRRIDRPHPSMTRMNVVGRFNRGTRCPIGSQTVDRNGISGRFESAQPLWALVSCCSCSNHSDKVDLLMFCRRLARSPRLISLRVLREVNNQIMHYQPERESIGYGRPDRRGGLCEPMSSAGPCAARRPCHRGRAALCRWATERKNAITFPRRRWRPSGALGWSRKSARWDCRATIPMTRCFAPQATGYELTRIPYCSKI